METRDASIYKKYKAMRNSVRNATRKLQKEEQKKVATHCRENPKIFGNTSIVNDRFVTTSVTWRLMIRMVIC